MSMDAIYAKDLIFIDLVESVHITPHAIYWRRLLLSTYQVWVVESDIVFGAQFAMLLLILVFL
jgi:hypothetical protein